MKIKSIYVIGSLRNPTIPIIGNALRDAGLDVFDDWFSGGPDADDCWRDYEKGRGRNYAEALQGWAAQNIFQFDRRHLLRVDAAVLVAPAGRSAHMELGWILGKDKPGFVLFPEGEPERWDVMYQFASGVFLSVDELVKHIKASGQLQSPSEIDALWRRFTGEGNYTTTEWRP